MAHATPQQLLTAAYDDYSDAIFRHCYFRVSDRELGLEIMQDTFTKTWEYLASGKGVENIRAFLYRTANNLVIDHQRRAKKRRQDSLETLQEEGFDIAGEEDTTLATEQAFTAERVTQLLSQIKEPYKTAVMLRYIDDLSPAEIADVLGVSANTASVRINRGLDRLRSLLQSNG